MFRLSRPLFQAVAQKPLKASTGITGLAVHPDPLPALLSTYRSTLAILQTMPAEAVYRQATESIINHRVKVIEASKGDIEHVETELDAGMVEQLIEQAKDEELLAGKMREWKAWEPLQVKPAPKQWEYFERGE